MLDYDAEAPRYDATRGGIERARTAAEAVDSLLPGKARLVLDLAGGTGLIAQELARLGHHMLVADRSAGMLRLASGRLPGRVLQADAGRLPLADNSMDAVSTVWLLHLLPDRSAAGAVLGEIARVLRPDGDYVTTIDKATAHRRRPPEPAAIDARDAVLAMAATHGLRHVGETTFIGWGLAREGHTDPTFTLVCLRKTSRRSGAPA